MMKRILSLLLSLVLLTGCSALPGASRNLDGLKPRSGVKAMISWVDFIKLNGVTFMGTEFQAQAVGLGPEIGKVKFKVAENVFDPNYKIKDGDAAFIEAGSSIFALKNYAIKFRIAVRQGSSYKIYEADGNPGAKTGGELLDIGDKVKYMGINSEQDGKTQLGEIREQVKVNELVKLVLDAPVDQDQRNDGGERYFVVFYLADGTFVRRSFWLESGELSRGMLLPNEFGAAIKQALKH